MMGLVYSGGTGPSDVYWKIWDAPVETFLWLALEERNVPWHRQAWKAECQNLDDHGAAWAESKLWSAGTSGWRSGCARAVGPEEPPGGGCLYARSVSERLQASCHHPWLKQEQDSTSWEEQWNRSKPRSKWAEMSGTRPYEGLGRK